MGELLFRKLAVFATFRQISAATLVSNSCMLLIQITGQPSLERTKSLRSSLQPDNVILQDR